MNAKEMNSLYGGTYLKKSDIIGQNLDAMALNVQQSKYGVVLVMTLTTGEKVAFNGSQSAILISALHLHEGDCVKGAEGECLFSGYFDTVKTRNGTAYVFIFTNVYLDM